MAASSAATRPCATWPPREDPIDRKTLLDGLELNPRVLAELVSATGADAPSRKTAVHPEYERNGFELLVRHIALHDGMHLARIEDLWLLEDGSLKPTE